MKVIMSQNNSIFSSDRSLDNFCYDIATAWIEYCESKSLPYTDVDWVEWIDGDLLPAMDNAYGDAIIDIKDGI